MHPVVDPHISATQDWPAANEAWSLWSPRSLLQPDVIRKRRRIG